jgi:ABC-type glycerol-3-phosphate transport system substrate-binding protein
MKRLSLPHAAPANRFAFLCLGLAAGAAGCAGADADSPAGDPAEVGVVLTTSSPPGGANVVLNEILANEPGS